VILKVDGQEARFDVENVERAYLVLDLDEYQRLAGNAGPPSSQESGHDQQ